MRFENNVVYLQKKKLMNTLTIKEALTEQKVEIERLLSRDTVERPEAKFINLNSELAQVVIGVRRSGKSTLCHQVIRGSKLKYAYVNFDDERLTTLKGEQLNDVLRSLYDIYGKFELLFLDEIQNISDWYLFVNRLLRAGFHILITGSNAKLLSGELATHLTGRHETVSLYPFSFKEYCTYHHIDTTQQTTMVDGLRKAAFETYMKTGGFPDIVKNTVNDNYIDDLVHNIVYRDIQQRYSIRHIGIFRQIVDHILNTSPSKINIKELQDLFGISFQTAENYLTYIKEAYLVISVKKFSPKSRIRIRNEKLYAVDHGLMSNRRDAFSGENLGWRLETIALIQLMRIHNRFRRDIYYYEDTKAEADFLVCKGNTVLEIIQVSYDISNPKTRARELKGLELAAVKTGCTKLTLITLDQREHTETKHGLKVNIVPIVDWLLNPDE